MDMAAKFKLDLCRNVISTAVVFYRYRGLFQERMRTPKLLRHTFNSMRIDFLHLQSVVIASHFPDLEFLSAAKTSRGPWQTSFLNLISLILPSCSFLSNFHSRISLSDIYELATMFYYCRDLVRCQQP